jgi:CDGSH-type Zn-finger protein
MGRGKRSKNTMKHIEVATITGKRSQMDLVLCKCGQNMVLPHSLCLTCRTASLVNLPSTQKTPSNGDIYNQLKYEPAIETEPLILCQCGEFYAPQGELCFKCRL